MVDDDTDNKKQLEMQETEPLLRLSGTHILRYAVFIVLLCVEVASSSKLPIGKVF